jgi:hypothetical protein
VQAINRNSALSHKTYQRFTTAAAHCGRRICICILLFTGASLHAQEPPAANPGRPTVSTPATLTPVGYLQFENGGLYATNSQEFDNQFSATQVTKLTITPRLQLLTSWQPFASSDVDGDRAVQRGGFALGAQAVVLPGKDKRPTIALSYFHSVYDGQSPDIDIGSSSQSALLLLSDDLGHFHIDTNVILNEQIDAPVRRAQFGQTLSISHPIGSRFTLAGELWHFTQPLTHGNAAGNLWAVSYALRPNLIFDTGFNRGLTTTSTQWEGFAGFTYVLPHRLWHTR